MTCTDVPRFPDGKCRASQSMRSACTTSSTPPLGDSFFPLRDWLSSFPPAANELPLSLQRAVWRAHLPLSLESKHSDVLAQSKHSIHTLLDTTTTCGRSSYGFTPHGVEVWVPFPSGSTSDLHSGPP
ncbi:hypothetical protein C8Q77DRAFT_665304 [Trametes polyzona]|nr:hypothetical protein C8Q77DRAFT_665304 [Trametes polyzona]